MKKPTPRLIWMKTFVLYFLPLLLFVAYSFLSYPLKPQCSLGKGVKGCVATCEAISFFEDGRPAAYKETPCFHGEPGNSYKLIYKYYYFIYPPIILAIALLYFWKKNLVKGIFTWVLFAPIKIIKQNRISKNIFSKIVVYLMLIPLILEWLFGYVFVITDLIGIDLFAQNNEQQLTQSISPQVISDSMSCNEQISLNNAKNCTMLVLRDDGGHGTGFSISSGYLLTNNHVVEGAKKLSTWFNGKEQPLVVWNYSPIYDLAILKLPENLPTCSWLDSSRLEIAETLYAVGWPNTPTGESTITKGIYSRLNLFESGLEFLQTDAPINPGNSGGPLINKCGVVGINTLKESWSAEQLPRPLEGMGNAISSKTLIPIVDQMIKEGSIRDIPQAPKAQQVKSYGVPNNSVTISIEEIRSYINRLRVVKASWENTERCPGDKIKQLMDSLERQVLFSQTLLDRLISKNGVASGDDLFMWDSVIKMSWESSGIAAELNATCNR